MEFSARCEEAEGVCSRVLQVYLEQVLVKMEVTVEVAMASSCCSMVSYHCPAGNRAKLLT